jgi:CheY-like chemotaxis protein
VNIPAQFIVVDDDPINNMVCKYTISSLAPKADIQLFTDPEKALASIKAQYDDGTMSLETVLFLDINMPVMNGWEFLDELSSFPDDLRSHFTIYILSSSIDPEDIADAEQHPYVNGYYSKPLSKQTLHQICKID